jgi:nucleoid-associated protein YgaU
MDAQSSAKLPFNLKIVPTTKDGIPLPLPFVAMFNPESFAIHEDVVWCTQAARGKSSATAKYVNVKPRTFTMEFTLDGTGVNTNGVKIPVTAQVALFRAVTTKVRGTIHRPSYLMVQYGTFINVCVLNSSDVTYTMFDMFGLPIRAKITAKFTEQLLGGLSNVLDMLSSPDLTQRVVVKDGDLLPLLTYQTYNDQTYYLQVARANKLRNFRRLEPGATLVFPPIAKA